MCLQDVQAFCRPSAYKCLLFLLREPRNYPLPSIFAMRWRRDSHASAACNSYDAELNVECQLKRITAQNFCPQKASAGHEFMHSSLFGDSIESGAQTASHLPSAIEPAGEKLAARMGTNKCNSGWLFDFEHFCAFDAIINFVSIFHFFLASAFAITFDCAPT